MKTRSKKKTPRKRRKKIVVAKDATMEIFRADALKRLKTATAFVVVTAEDGMLKFNQAATEEQIRKIGKKLVSQVGGYPD